MDGATCPSAMKTLAVDIVTLEVSLLPSATVTPPVGAAVPKVTGNGTDWFGASVTLDGRPMVPVLSTVTFAVVSGMYGVAPAWITAVPGPIAVTGMTRVEMELPSGKNVC